MRRSRRRFVRAFTAIMPLAVPAGMALILGATVRRWGRRTGYMAGFAAYWAVCVTLPLALLGRARFRALLTAPPRPLPRPRLLAVAALILPPAGGIAVELIPGLRRADSGLIAASIGL